MTNALQIGQKVKYEGQTAIVVALASPFGAYPCVVLEYPAVFAVTGNRLVYKNVRREVAEFGLKAAV